MRLNLRNKKNYLYVCILSVLIFYAICHLFMLMNPSYSHDSLLVVSSNDNIHQVSIGRFLQPLYRAIRGNITAPWLIGILSVAFLSLTLYIISIFLDFRSASAIILTAGILTTNTTVIFSNATYLPWVDIYALALLLATLAAFFAIRFRYGVLWGAVCLFLALGLYQSFITVTIGLVMLFTVRALLLKCDVQTIRNIILKGIATVILGFILYLVGYYVSSLIVPPSDAYNSLGSVGSGLFSRILMKVIETYFTFIWEIVFIIKDRVVVTAIVLFGIAAFTVKALFDRIKTTKLQIGGCLFLLLILLALPFGLNANYFISGNTVYHSLMNYGCFLIYVLPIMIYDMSAPCTSELDNADQNEPFKTKKGKRMAVILPALIGIILFDNIVFANGIYTEKYLQAGMTLSAMTRVVDEMESIKGFIPGETPIAIIGNLNSSILVSQNKEFNGYEGIGVVPNHFSVTYYNTYTQYLTYILGYPLAEITEDEIQILESDVQVANMPAFPESGYCKMINGYMVVKLSE